MRTLARLVVLFILIFLISTSALLAQKTDVKQVFSLGEHLNTQAPVNLEVDQKFIFALFWTTDANGNHLCLVRLNRSTHKSSKLSLATEINVANVRQELIFSGGKDRLLYLYTTHNDKGVATGKLGEIDAETFTSGRSMDLGKLGSEHASFYLGHPIDDRISVLKYFLTSNASNIQIFDIACDTLESVGTLNLELPRPIGTFASVGRSAIWFTPYGLMNPEVGGQIIGVPFDSPKNVTRIKMQVGDYLGGIQGVTDGVIASVNHGSPEGVRGSELMLFNSSGRETSRLTVDVDCELDSPAVSSLQDVGISRCVRLKRGLFDTYSVAVNKLVVYGIGQGQLSMVKVLSVPYPQIRAVAAWQDAVGHLEIFAVDDKGRILSFL